MEYRRPKALGLAALATWADTPPPAALARAVTASLADEPPQFDPPRFPCDAELNRKIILWQGDVRRLDVDAVVNETNESLRDRSGLSGALFAAAGPDLDFECAHTEGCRTGDAVLTKAGALRASYVIHTVGPRYNKKYHTAAENALHNCYRSVMRVCIEQKLRSMERRQSMEQTEDTSRRRRSSRVTRYPKSTANVFPTHTKMDLRRLPGSGKLG